MRARLPEEGVEEHRLPDAHVRRERVVPAHVRHAVPQPRRGHRNAVQDDLAGQLERPRVVGVGQNVADGRAFAL